MVNMTGKLVSDPHIDMLNKDRNEFKYLKGNLTMISLFYTLV